MIATSDLEHELRILLGLAHRLMPALNHKPELFHEQKDALARGIKDLMERCGFQIPKSPRAFAAKHFDAGYAAVRHNGRAIPIERRIR